jgi:hypothetical protein
VIGNKSRGLVIRLQLTLCVGFVVRAGLLFSLRDLLSASGVFLLLALDFRLALFLRCLLAFGFWRFVAHDPKAKV